MFKLYLRKHVSSFLQVVQAAWWCKKKSYLNPKYVWN